MSPPMRVTTITAAILAAVIAAAVTLLAVRLQPPQPADGDRRPDAPVALAPEVGVASPSAMPATAGPGSGPSAASDDTPAVATRSARLADVQPADRVAPQRLSIPAIGIADAPIDSVGVDPDGSMEIPTDVRRVGWYDYGPAPGEGGGSAVLTAHVDSREQGAGVFYDLDGLTRGDEVEVGMSDGGRRTFVVDEVRQIPKVELPTGDLFRRDGRHQVALITCGGEFDASSRHYRDNLVVIATPTS
jgi:LPXTG-site transpeptidase (sortase) family protein